MASAKTNPSHIKVPPTSGWTGCSVEGRVFPISVGPAQQAGPPDSGKIRSSTAKPVQPDVSGTLVSVGLVFAETVKSTRDDPLPMIANAMQDTARKEVQLALATGDP